MREELEIKLKRLEDLLRPNRIITTQIIYEILKAFRDLIETLADEKEN